MPTQAPWPTETPTPDSWEPSGSVLDSTVLKDVSVSDPEVHRISSRNRTVGFSTKLLIPTIVLTNNNGLESTKPRVRHFISVKYLKERKKV